MPRVLVVDDEVGVRTALSRGLRAEGMDVVAVADGPTALRAALFGEFDVILLDIILPGLSGYRVLQRLRAAGVDTPVLLVSAKDGEVDQADGLDLGADGYLVKPFSFVVLLARLRALLRRRVTEDDNVRPPLRVGQLVVEPDTRQVRWAGRAVRLSPREYTLIYALASRPDTVLSKDELRWMVWGDNQTVSPNAVEVYIGYLRRKLQAAGAENVLRTIRGQGYRFNATKP
jgi:DNA-binding response OmpR family regulator